MVRCVECGYLVLRNQWTQQLESAEDPYRKTGKLVEGFIAAKGEKVIHENIPVCWQGAFDLASEAVEDRPQDGFAMASKDRECSAFRKYCRGRTPKEHLEMELLEDQRRWQERQEKVADQRHRESLAVVVSATNKTLWAAIAAAGLGAAATLGAVWLAQVIQQPAVQPIPTMAPPATPPSPQATP